MVVCHVITQLELGGAQRNTLYTVAHLDRREFAPHLVAGPGGLLDGEAARQADLPFATCPHLVRPVAPHRDLGALAWLVRHFRELRPQLVHTHSSKAGVLGRLAAHLAGVPLVVHTVHGWGFHPFQSRGRRLLFQGAEWMVAPLTTRFVAVSRENEAQGLALGLLAPGEATLIRSGVELERFRRAEASGALRRELGIGPETPLAGMVACLKPQKAPEDFVRVAVRVSAALPAAHFVLAGDGALRGAVEELVRREGLEGRFHLLGWRSDPETVVGDLDVLVLTSLHEGLPRVVAEAMAAGKPVVATAVDGTPEAVRDGLTGYLAPPRDPERLAERVTALLRDREAARRMGEAGRDLAEEWDIDRMVRRQEELYRRLARAAA
jgi:glycosyltransferase involved in cell wall biosynthesis